MSVLSLYPKIVVKDNSPEISYTVMNEYGEVTLGPGRDMYLPNHQTLTYLLDGFFKKLRKRTLTPGTPLYNYCNMLLRGCKTRYALYNSKIKCWLCCYEDGSTEWTADELDDEIAVCESPEDLSLIMAEHDLTDCHVEVRFYPEAPDA